MFFVNRKRLKKMSILIDLDEAAKAADPNVVGVLVLNGTQIQPGWHVVTRGDGLQVRIDTATGQAPLQAAINAVMNIDLSAPVVAARELVRAKAAAQALFLADKVAVAVALSAGGAINVIRAAFCVGTATGVWNPASMANGSGVTSPALTVPGAAFLDVVDVGAPYSLQGVIAHGYVSAVNAVVIRLQNGTGAAVDFASGTWGVAVRRPVFAPPITTQQLLDDVTAKIAAG